MRQGLLGKALAKVALTTAFVGSLSGCIHSTFYAFTPPRGPVCSQVEVTGTYLEPGTASVTFGGVPATEIIVHRLAYPSTDSYALVATVPLGTPLGQVAVQATITPSSGNPLFKGGTSNFTNKFDVTGTRSIPTINAFTASPTSIKAGETTTLTWNVQQPLTALTINGIDVLNTASYVGTPSTTTTYTLTASDWCLTRQKSLLVTVTPAFSLVSLTPASLLVSRGSSATTTAAITPDTVPVSVTCTAKAGISCMPVTIAAGGTSAMLTVAADGTATFGPESISVNAEEKVPGGMSSTKTLEVTVGRATGPFSEITSAVQGDTTSPPIYSSNGLCSAKVIAGTTSTSLPYEAVLSCNSVANTYDLPFAVGGTYKLGGVGFSANAALAVVVTPSVNAQAYDFFVVGLPAGIGSMSEKTFEAYDSTGTASSEPHFYVSPDATLAIVVQANKSGSPSLVSALTPYDLTTGQALAALPVQFSATFSARVINQGTSQYIHIVPDVGSQVYVSIP